MNDVVFISMNALKIKSIIPYLYFMMDTADQAIFAIKIFTVSLTVKFKISGSRVNIYKNYFIAHSQHSTNARHSISSIPIMLLLFSIGLAALPLLLLAPIILIIQCGCCTKKNKKKILPKPKQLQGAKPTGILPPVKQQGAPAHAQQPTMQIQPGTAQPQMIAVPAQQAGGTPTIFLMQPPTQPGGTPTLVQMSPEFASTIQTAPVQGPAATAMTPAKPSDEKQTSPPSKGLKDESPKTKETTKDDLYEEIAVATAIKNGDRSKRATTEKENGSGSKRATAEPEQLVEKRNEGMADLAAGQYQTLADLDVNAVFTKKK